MSERYNRPNDVEAIFRAVVTVDGVREVYGPYATIGPAKQQVTRREKAEGRRWRHAEFRKSGDEPTSPAPVVEGHVQTAQVKWKDVE